MSRLTNLCLSFLIAVVSVLAVQAQKPEIRKYAFDDSGILQSMSDNGEWAIVGFGTSDLSEMGKVKVLNVKTGAYEDLQTEEEVTLYGKQTANDITNDGETVVGAFKGEPAYWTRSTRQWSVLPMPVGCTGAVVTHVTPDGRYAIGRGLSASSEYFSKGVMWDIKMGSIITLPNLPVLDMSHEDQNQQQFISLSNDGRYVLGSLSYSYLLPVAPCVFLYDRVTATAKFIGFDPSDTQDWKPWSNGLAFIDEGRISPNGKYVACHAWLYESSGSSAANVDGDAVAYYDVESGEFAVLEGSNGMYPTVVDNNGTVYAASPAGNPLREWSVYRNGYWYPVSQILVQKYGIDFYAQTKYGNTGTVMDASGDGKFLSIMVDPRGESYTMALPGPIGPLCDDINLLGNYSVSPASGSTFTKLRSVEITFDRKVEFIGKDVKAAVLTKSDGTFVRATSGIAVSSKSDNTIVLTFRTETLEAGETYEVTVPAGIISIAGDPDKVNSEIKITYNGRADEPVAVKEVYPKDGSVLAKIDNGSNPVAITFDSQITLAANASAELRLIDGDSYDKVCSLTTYVNGTTLYLYPAATQYLYNEKHYQVVVGKGSVSDYSGSGLSEEIVLHYTGSYIREISHDNAILFKDDFSNQAQSLINFMRYEGDHLTPVADMQALGFDADNQPWNFSIREDKTSTDYCAGATSMYSPAGQSNDWMVVPQLEIPDEYVFLTFKAQSYKNGMNDRLKVLVWECDENINAMSSEVITRFAAEAKVVFNEVLTPGATEEGLTGEWGEYVVDLAEYSGKKIYIAFLNENMNKSAVFVDDIQVMREMKFFVSLTSQEKVVNRDDIMIAGVLTANADNETFTSAKLTLKDSKGNPVDEIMATGLSLAKGDKYAFSFSKPLILEKGTSNKCVIEVEMGNYKDNVNCIIKNLAFEPTKRVVLEEVTGVTCGNCPQGIIAIEHLKDIYGDAIIPISIHTYTGDPFAGGLAPYSSYLGLSSAPSAMIQRNGIISFPMAADVLTGDYTLSNGYTLWKDLVAAEFETPADAELSAEYQLDAESGTFDLPVTVKYAMDANNLNLNIFVVMLEDGIKSYQENYFSASSDPAYGEWGVGGIYGQSIVYDYMHYDLARACWGTSYSGTAGLLPQSMKAGEAVTAQLTGFTMPENVDVAANTRAVVMLIDGNTDKLINAVCVKPQGYTGINDAQANENICQITAGNGFVKIAANSNITAEVYTTAGLLIGAANGKGTVSVPVNHKGIAVVRAVADGKVTVKKVVL